MPFPLISIIIPTFNRAHFLPEAIESIKKQNYTNLEIIIVDDGSTDNTKQLVQNLGKSIKYIYQENKGPAAARNAGLRIVNGEIIGFLDSDDLWPDNKLSIQLDRLINSDIIEVIFGGVKHLMLNKSVDKEFIEHSESFNRNAFGSALFKKTSFNKVGLLNEKLLHWEYLDWILRAKELGINILRQKEITLILRIHEENISRNIAERNKYLSKVLKASIERRRKSNNGNVNKLSLM